MPPTYLRVLLVMLLAPRTSSQQQPTQTACLAPGDRLTRPVLRDLIFQLRRATFGTLKLAAAEWESHEVVTEIFRILVDEYLGHSVQVVPISGTTGTYQMLSSGELDINVELWGSVAPEERRRYMPPYFGRHIIGTGLDTSTAASAGVMGGAVDAGALDYTRASRSGIYIRPSKDQVETVLQHGRFYASFESIVLPLMPEMTALLPQCTLPDNGQVGERCIDAVSTRCVTRSVGTSGRANATDVRECKAIFKETPTYDPGQLERMITSGDLPLAIMYTGVGGMERMLRYDAAHDVATSETVLFHWWEPSALILNTSNIMRMYFESARACSTESQMLYPEKVVCDFDEGHLHKGFSQRLLRENIGDVVTLLENIQFDSSSLNQLLQRAVERSNGTSRIVATHERHAAACEWVLQNRHVWMNWLRERERESTSVRIGVTVMVASAGVLVLAMLLWLCVPLFMRDADRLPTPSQTWFKWANSPGLLFMVLWPCRRYTTRMTEATSQLLGDVSMSVASGLDDWVDNKGKHGSTSRLATGLSNIFRSHRVQPGPLTPRSNDQVHGVKWAAAATYGIEGEKLYLNIVRHESQASQNTPLCIWAEDLSTKRLSAKTVARLGVQRLAMEAGQTHEIFELQLIRDRSGLDVAHGVWQPQVSIELHLGPEKGCISDTCKVHIIDCDDWPTAGASKMPRHKIFNAFVWGVIAQNATEHEVWWLIGACFRAAHANIIDPLLTLWLLDGVVDHADVELGIQLAITKVVLLFLDQYTSNHYSSNCGIAQMAPLQWMLYKWQSLPLDEQLDQERVEGFQNLLARADTLFTTTGYATFTQFVQLTINVVCSLVATAILAPANAMYLYAAYAVSFSVILIVVGKTSPTRFEVVSDAYWKVNKTFAHMKMLMLTEVMAVVTSSSMPRIVEAAIEAHSQRTDKGFLMYFITETKVTYTRWIMMVIPIALYATSAVMVEFSLITRGMLVGVISTIGSARNNLIALIELQDQMKLAVDLVHDLAAALNASSDRVMLRAVHSERQARLVSSVGPSKLELLTHLSLHGVDLWSPATSSCDDELVSLRSGLMDANGSIPLGCLYGFVQAGAEATPNIQQSHNTLRMELLMLLFGQHVTPTAGVVLVPPHVRVRVVTRQPAICERDSILQNLTFALPGSMKTEIADDDALVEQISALCIKLGMRSHLFGMNRIRSPLMQAESMASMHEMKLVALVRMILYACTDTRRRMHVLLIQDLGTLTDAHARAVHSVLVRFAAGHDLAAMIADKEPTPGVGGRMPRTVVWAAPLRTLTVCGITQEARLSDTNELSVAPLIATPLALAPTRRPPPPPPR